MTLRPPMTLRLRLVVAAATAVAIAIVLFSAGAYLITSHQLREQVDASLEHGISGGIVGRPATPVALVQFVDANGDAFAFQRGRLVRSTPILPIGGIERRAATETSSVIHLHDATFGHEHIRVATTGVEVAPGVVLAIEEGQSLEAVDATLKRLVPLLGLLALGGIALAAALGTMVAKAALAPVERLTAEAERVATTRDLTASIDVHGADEVARLATTLNSMLAALDESQRAQRRLVADASHELRTPLTSLRTNLEVLARGHTMSESDRQSLLGDLVAQAAELGTLVGQLVDLDKTDADVAELPVAVAFDEVVGRAVSRVRRNAPAVTFVANIEPTVVIGVAPTLERAASNLLENAAKWSPPGSTVEVGLRGGLLTVRDHGPGIDPADAPHVFERFYRSVAAKGLPGSGLGLSIVREAAEEHGGRAWVEPASGGGTTACFQVPLAPVPAETEALYWAAPALSLPTFPTAESPPNPSTVPAPPPPGASPPSGIESPVGRN
jgi:two-component system sensor histidine kinase MprB